VIRIPTDEEKARFRALCRKHAAFEVRGGEFDGIGIYNEKRLHRILKEFVCEDESCFEIKLGGAVADVFCDGLVSEIQTGGFYPLKKKIDGYLSEEEIRVRIIHPVICERTIVRVDPVSAEVLYARKSPKKESALKILPELIYFADHLSSDRLCVEVYSVKAEEHRYSDEIHRYRKSGKRDSELFPTELESVTVIESREDLLALLPEALVRSDAPFTAAEFQKFSGLRGRKGYNALGALCAAGVLKKEKDGKRAAEYYVER
jgi:hypothetical protein